MRKVPPRRARSSRGLPYHQPFETRLGDSVGRRELQGTLERLSEERFQDSSTARKVRDRKKTNLSLHTKATLPRRSGSEPLEAPLLYFSESEPRTPFKRP